ncbi:MAG: hypothetical protein QX189_03365 [Methylococcales bacterium]
MTTCEWASDETAIPQQIFPSLRPYRQKQLLDKDFYSDDSNYTS